MSTNHDRLAKCVLEETLDPVGITRREFEIEPGFLRRADFLFQPQDLPPEPTWPEYLRVLYRMVQTKCLFEFSSTPPDEDELLDMHCKQMNLRNQHRQQGEAGQGAMPRLWVLSWGCPVKGFAALGVEKKPDWPKGFYWLPLPWLKFGIVVLPELERTRETVVLRLTGPPRVRQEALAEIATIAVGDPEYLAIKTLVAALHHAIERDRLIPQEDKEAFMTRARAEIEEIVTQSRNQGLTQGLAQGMLALLQDTYSLRFGEPLPPDVAEQFKDLEAPDVLRRAHALALRATDHSAAAEGLRALLVSSN